MLGVIAGLKKTTLDKILPAGAAAVRLAPSSLTLLAPNPTTTLNDLRSFEAPFLLPVKSADGHGLAIETYRCRAHSGLSCLIF